MTEHDLELRIQAVALALDAGTPAFDPATLRAVRRRRVRRTFVALAAVAAFAGLTAAPAAVSALGDLFGVDPVPELGAIAPDVAPPYLGEQVALDDARRVVPFPLRTIPSLGMPDAAYVRMDIVASMATVAYDGGQTLLTQWRATNVRARIAVVPASGTADEVTVDGLRALWTAGTARGTFTLVGADGALHRELFDVSGGALLWEDDGVAFLLQGAGTKSHATELAASVGP